MLSKKLVSKMNDQIVCEIEASHLYLQMSAWCARKGLSGCAQFLRDHSELERNHSLRLFGYITETGEMPIIKAIAAPDHEFESILTVFELILENELRVTQKINSLVDIALEEKDYSTFHFLQWYVAEQHEEEYLFNSILDKIRIIGIEDEKLMLVDREIASMQGLNKK